MLAAAALARDMNMAMVVEQWKVLAMQRRL